MIYNTTVGANRILDNLLRNAALDPGSVDVIRIMNAGKTTLLGQWSITNAQWIGPIDGEVALISPLPSTYSQLAAGTAGVVQLANNFLSVDNAFDDLTVGTSGAVDVVLTTLDSTAAPKVLRLSLKMDNPTKYSSAWRNRVMDHIIDRVAAVGVGANGGTLKIYTGSAPSNADAAATGTELLSYALTNTSWAAAVTKSSALSGNLTTSGITNGTAGYGILTLSNSAFKMLATVGTTGSGADVIIDTTTIVQSQSHVVSEFTIGFA